MPQAFKDVRKGRDDQEGTGESHDRIRIVGIDSKKVAGVDDQKDRGDQKGAIPDDSFPFPQQKEDAGRQAEIPEELRSLRTRIADEDLKYEKDQEGHGDPEKDHHLLQSPEQAQRAKQPAGDQEFDRSFQEATAQEVGEGETAHEDQADKGEVGEEKPLPSLFELELLQPHGRKGRGPKHLKQDLECLSHLQASFAGIPIHPSALGGTSTLFPKNLSYLGAMRRYGGWR